MMVAVAPPPKYQRRPDRVRPPRATPGPSPARSRSRSATPGGPPRCKHCNAATLAHEEGGLVCQTCGIINEEDSNFRAEIEFDESASGAVKTRGTHVGAHQTHNKVYANRVGAAAGGHVGLEATKAKERANTNALHKIQHFAQYLGIRETEVDRAMFIFGSAYARQFYRGRTLESVAIVCLYLAIRQCTTRDRYALMLIDFAELSQGYYNVFELGKMAKALQDMLYLDPSRTQWWSLERRKADTSDPRLIADFTAQQDNLYKGRDMLSLQDPEDLIERFCDKLDFGDATNFVKRDAAKVAQSMNRDWMTTGRRPAGIAGAAVIIAARMNNFRRTLREVVLVAKVTEITLSKRIEEFKETKSSTMSVQTFRSTDPTSLQGSDVQNPPSYYRALPEWQDKQSKKKKRKRKSRKLQESAAAIENDIDEQTETEGEGGSSDENTTPDWESNEQQSQAKRPRLDADGFVVPDLPNRPIDVAQNGATPRRKVGKPKGAKNWQPRPPTAEEEAEERELERDIQEQLNINASLDPTGTLSRLVDDPRDGNADVQLPDMPSPPDRSAVGPSVNSVIGNTGTVSMEESLGNDEFEDDPDVANCLLNEAERAFKETVWVEENKDWLRTEHAKKIKRELKDRELREKGIDPEKERTKKLRRKDGMQRAGRAGDISYLEEARNKQREADVNQGQPDRTARAAEDGELGEERRRSVSMEARGSVQVMMQQRGTFSRRVDYNKLSQAYVLPGFEDSSESRSESPASNSFYRPHVSRGHGNSNIRRARATASRIAGTLTSYETDGDTDFDQAPSRPRPVPQRQQSSNEEDDEDDAEYEKDQGTPEAPATQSQNARGRQPPTPSSTQPRAARASPIVLDDSETSESPLSSTHTPVGYGSGASNTSLAAQQQSSQRQPDGEDDESSGDEDDYVDEEDDEGDDLDKFFGAGDTEQVMGEAEEVDDDV